eukprot:scaffold99937_cov31-Tisochrysis_lutea.AAC.2
MPRTSYYPARPPPLQGAEAEMPGSAVTRVEIEEMGDRLCQLTTVWRSGSRRLELLEALSAEQDAKIGATVDVIRKVQALIDEGHERYERQIATLTAEVASLRGEASDLRSTLRSDVSELRSSVVDAMSRLAALGAAVDVSNMHVHERMKDALDEQSAESKSTLSAVSSMMDALKEQVDADAARQDRERILEEEISTLRKDMSRLLDRIAAVEEEAGHKAIVNVASGGGVVETRGCGPCVHAKPDEQSSPVAMNPVVGGAPAVSPMQACYYSHLDKSCTHSRAAPLHAACYEAPAAAIKSQMMAGAASASAPVVATSDPAALAAQQLLNSLGAALLSSRAAEAIPRPTMHAQPMGDGARAESDALASLIELQSHIERLQQRAGAASAALAEQYTIRATPPSLCSECRSSSRRVGDRSPPTTPQPDDLRSRSAHYAAMHAPAFTATAPADVNSASSGLSALAALQHLVSQTPFDTDVPAGMKAVCSEVIAELLRKAQVGQVGVPSARPTR